MPKRIHTGDENEWYNLAENEKYQEVIENLREHLPKDNARWSKASVYDFNKYLTRQRREQLEK